MKKIFSCVISLILTFCLIPLNYSRAENTKVTDIKGAQESYVYFGTYIQSGISDAKPEPIKWRVLENNASDGKLLLLSDKNLDVQPFDNSKNNSKFWENSTLKNWLNDNNKGFLGTAFTKDEKAAILSTKIDNEINANVFCLTKSDIENVSYGFKNDESARSLNTDYVKSKPGMYSTYDYWWLRTPTAYEQNVYDVNDRGKVDYDGDKVFSTDVAVRPAICLDANKVTITSVSDNCYTLGLIDYTKLEEPKKSVESTSGEAPTDPPTINGLNRVLKTTEKAHVYGYTTEGTLTPLSNRLRKYKLVDANRGTFNIIVTGGNANLTENIPFGETISLSPDNKEIFKSWKLSSEEVISYIPTFKFRAIQDLTLVASTDDNTSSSIPSAYAYLADPFLWNGKIMFLAYKSVAEGTSIKEWGIIIKKSDIDLNEILITDSDIIIVKGKSIKLFGDIVYGKNTFPQDQSKWYARTYIILSNGDVQYGQVKSYKQKQ